VDSSEDVDTIIRRGEALMKFGQPQSALRHFERAIVMRPGDVDALDSRALLLLETNRAVEALDQLQRMVDRDPESIDKRLNLIRALMSLGRADDAALRLQQHLDTNPDHCALHFYLAMVEPQQEHIVEIERLLDRPGLSELDTMYCHLALANILEAGESFDLAFDYFLKANTLHRGTLSYDPDENASFVDQLIEVYSKRRTQGKQRFGSATELPVFIVGMPRSGSTLVEQIIAAHSQAHGAGELQVMPAVAHLITQRLRHANPYPKCMSLLDGKLAEESCSMYLQELKLHNPAALRIVDKLPGNFLRVGLIKTLFPNARIIDCQRNPLDNCISLFFHFFPNQLQTFELTELGRYYLDYQRLMSHWEKLFPGEILTLRYEDLISEQESTSKQLLDYLGLEWDVRCLDFHTNERAVMTSSSLQVRKPIYKTSVDRWRHYENHLQPLISVLSK